MKVSHMKNKENSPIGEPFVADRDVVHLCEIGKYKEFISLSTCLLLGAPGTSLSAGVPGSLLVASLLRGLPCPVLPQESSCLPRQSTSVSNKELLLN